MPYPRRFTPGDRVERDPDNSKNQNHWAKNGPYQRGEVVRPHREVQGREVVWVKWDGSGEVLYIDAEQVRLEGRNEYCVFEPGVTSLAKGLHDYPFDRGTYRGDKPEDAAMAFAKTGLPEFRHGKKLRVLVVGPGGTYGGVGAWAFELAPSEPVVIQPDDLYEVTAV